MSKSVRHLTIKQIIAHRSIGSQEELCEALHRAGIEATQATLSRDLRELGVIRMNTQNGPRYVLHPLSEEHRLQTVIGYEVERIDANEAMVIIRTLPGRAPGVASFIDSLQHHNIIGTIAGDDTVLVIPSSTKKTRSILKALTKSLVARAA